MIMEDNINYAVGLNNSDYITFSPTISKFAAAMVALQADLSPVIKDATNPQFKSKYASYDSVISTLRPHLCKHGLFIAIFPTREATATAVVMHVSGEFMMATTDTYPKDKSPQPMGSALTYIKRYITSAVFGLATEEDDDGHAGTHGAPAQQVRRAVANRGFDPHDRTMRSALERALTELKVEKELWDLVAERMIGKSSAELKAVIANLGGE